MFVLLCSATIVFDCFECLKFDPDLRARFMKFQVRHSFGTAEPTRFASHDLRVSALISRLMTGWLAGWLADNATDYPIMLLISR